MGDSYDLGNVSGYSNNESNIMGSKEFLESNSLVAKVAFLNGTQKTPGPHPGF